MRIEVAHGFFPCPRWVFVRQGQHLLDEIGYGLGILSSFFG